MGVRAYKVDPRYILMYLRQTRRHAPVAELCAEFCAGPYSIQHSLDTLIACGVVDYKTELIPTVSKRHRYTNCYFACDCEDWFMDE